jgi:hypothetical protein
MPSAPPLAYLLCEHLAMRQLCALSVVLPDTRIRLATDPHVHLGAVLTLAKMAVAHLWVFIELRERLVSAAPETPLHN